MPPAGPLVSLHAAAGERSKATLAISARVEFHTGVGGARCLFRTVCIVSFVLQSETGEQRMLKAHRNDGLHAGIALLIVLGLAPILYDLGHWEMLDRARVQYHLMVLDTACLEEREALLKSMEQVSVPNYGAM